MKHTIEIEGLPEGWEADKITLPSSLFIIANEVKYGTFLKLRKKQPRRILLEETEQIRGILPGEWGEINPGDLVYNSKINGNAYPGEYRIWREVKETDLSLHNDDDKESLRLSVDECKDFLKGNNFYLLNKIRNFLKDK